MTYLSRDIPPHTLRLCRTLLYLPLYLPLLPTYQYTTSMPREYKWKARSVLLAFILLLGYEHDIFVYLVSSDVSEFC